MLDLTGARLSPLNIRPSWEAFCAVPGTHAHKYKTNNAPQLGRLCVQPLSPGFLALPTEAVPTEPLLSRGRSPERQEIPFRSSLRTPSAAPLLHLHDNGPLIIGRTLPPCLSGPAFIQRTGPTYTSQITFKLWVSLVFPKQAVGVQHTRPECRAAAAAAPHAQGPVTGWLPPVLTWLNSPLDAWQTSNIKSISKLHNISTPFPFPPAAVFYLHQE